MNGVRTYTTAFTHAENPISESGNWTVPSEEGDGSLWGDVQTMPGLAFGVSEPTEFGDPTAILDGSWGPEQTVSATVRVDATPTTCCHEVEVRLRMTIWWGSITGYEAYCSINPSNPYCHIARWNGPNGSWCNLDSTAPSIYLKNGDVLKATVSGTNPVTLALYVNGTQELQVQDSGQNCSPGGAAGPWSSGSPGIGFYIGSYDTQDGNWGNFGFSRFTATDGPSA